MKKFWVVWVQDGDSPHHQHFSRQEAQAEAERLVVQTGKVAVILEAISWAKPPNVVVVWSKDFEYQLNEG